jgi:hypothetical protein
MGKVYNNPGTGAIFVENADGHLVWSTDRRPLNLLPEAQWITIPNQQIVFPNFNTFVNYGYIRYNTSWFGGGVGDSCLKSARSPISPWGRCRQGAITSTYG